MKNLLFVIIFCSFFSFFRLGSVTLFDVDEAVFAEAAKEMVHSGDYITPTYNGENRYDKPILFYWLMAVSYKVFGINEFAARFPSAVEGLILAVSIFLFIRHFFTEKMALYASLSFILSLFYFTYSHAAVTDMTLALFITLSVFSFYLSITRDNRSPKRINRYMYGFYLFSALAFLTKGLIGILFPFGIAVIYLLVTEGPGGVKKVFSLKGALLFLLVSAPWYAAESVINGREFFEQFIIKHHFKRFTGVISGHRGPVYYFVPVLIAGLFPWIAYLPAGIRNVFAGRRRGSESADGGSIVVNNNSLLMLSFIWFAFIFLFFSFSSTKLPNYILPAAPAAAILISSGITEGDRRWAVFANGFIAFVSLVAGAGFILAGRYMTRTGFSDVNWVYIAAAVLFIIAVAGLYSVWSKKITFRFMSAMMTAFLMLALIKALPAANNYLQGTLHEYSLYAGKVLHDDEKIVAYRINNPSVVFYSGHEVENVPGRDELLNIVSSHPGRLIAISKTKDIEILEGAGFHVLEKKDGSYAILERK